LLPLEKVAGLPKGALLTNTVRWADSEVKKTEVLVREMVDDLLRCPAERKEAAAREVLVTLRPHLKAAVEALETIGRERLLTNVEFVRRREFMLLVSAARRGDYK
jgi:hypothetical protein